MRRLVTVHVLVLATVSCALRLRELSVPSHVDIRQDATLNCNFSLSGANLYSVKWYKDDFEFYRYMPDNAPAGQAFPVPGVTLDEERCTMNSITLTNLTFGSSGTFRCEVSTEGPSFDTVYQASNMTVTGFPQEGPVVEGLRSAYLPGEMLVANCTSAPSHPAARITWYINDLPADRWLETATPFVETDYRGLQTLTVRLRLPAEQRFFKDGGRLRLRCSSVVGDVVFNNDMEAVLGGLGSQRLQQRPSHSAAVRGIPQHPITSVCALVLLLVWKLIP